MTGTAPATDPAERGETPLQSLERGLAVIETFTGGRSSPTLSEVARLTGITPATARRILLTLERLGYVRRSGRRFSLTPRVLGLGASCLSAMTPIDIAYPVMKDLVTQLGAWCSLALLAPPDIVYIARVHSGRILSIAGGVGSRLPAHATATGRVLLAGLAPEELSEFCDRWPLRQYTAHTIVDRGRLIAAVEEARRQGWALADQELELGLRGIAAPVTGADGRTFAGLSVSSTVAQLDVDELIGRCLTPLLGAAQTISNALQRGAGAGNREAVPWSPLSPGE
jgi:IclR family transcriptional regulator, pca regulon regulatory protein